MKNSAMSGNAIIARTTGFPPGVMTAAMTTETTAGPDDGLDSPWHEVAHYDDGHVNFQKHVAGVRTDEETT